MVPVSPQRCLESPILRAKTDRMNGENTPRDRELGREVEAPHDAYYGAQTVRAITEFPIFSIPISHFLESVRSLAIVERAAVLVNARLGDISDSKASAIAAACDDIAPGDRLAEFGSMCFRVGRGRPPMNMNEVISNPALEHLGLRRGRYDVIHANDNVNFSQSTNDVYPTATRLQILIGTPNH